MVCVLPSSEGEFAKRCLTTEEQSDVHQLRLWRECCWNFDLGPFLHTSCSPSHLTLCQKRRRGLDKLPCWLHLQTGRLFGCLHSDRYISLTNVRLWARVPFVNKYILCLSAPDCVTSHRSLTRLWNVLPSLLYLPKPASVTSGGRHV